MSKKTVLRLTVPRTDARGPLAFEQILASLHGLLAKSGIKSKLKNEESVSFEIVKSQRRIFFYAIVPHHLRTLIKSQFYAQYPAVQIEETPDYLKKSLIKDKNILLAEMKLETIPLFPIKRYPQFQDGKIFEDPLGPITSALSHLYSAEDSAILQLVIQPINKSWNESAEKSFRNFFRSGIWKWDWFKNLYYKKRFGFTKKERILASPIWKIMEGIGALSKMPAINEKHAPDETDAMENEARTTARHDRETTFGAVYDKITRLQFGVSARLAYFHSDPDPLHAETKIREIMGTFQQFSLGQMNGFSLKKIENSENTNLFKDFAKRSTNNAFPLSQEELATIFHLPTETVTSPSIAWVESPKMEPPPHLPDQKDDATIIGNTNFRERNEPYGIKPVDRRRHVYIIGKTGMGKSTMLENMIYSDILAGKGVGVIDPHGDLADAVLEFVPKNRTNDVILFDPADRDFPLAFNMLEGKNPEQRGLVASGLVGVLHKLFAHSWGPRLEYILRNTILALVEAPDTTMLGIMRMLIDPVYQAKILHYVKDPVVKSFWINEFQKLDPRARTEAIGPIQNKVGQFLSSPMIRNIVGQPKSTLNLRHAMDNGKIVIVNLSKGKIGEDNSALFGSMLITKFQLDAMSRADMKKEDRRDFSLYVDEFQNFATDSFATILSEARKYKLALTMANQYVAQMSDEVRAAVFGNVGSLISFQVGIDDAQVFASQFDEDRIAPIALASLPKYKVYNRIMVDGMTTPVFSGDALPPPKPNHNEDPQVRVQKIRNFSRQRYARPREAVEKKIERWSRPENQKGKKDKK